MISFRKIFLQLGFFTALVCILPAEEIHVAFCLDNNYVECTGVALYSLCKNKAPGDKLVIHVVMTEPLRPENGEKFRKLANQFPNVRIQIHDDERTIQCIAEAIDMPNGWKRIGERAWSVKSVAARLVLDKVLPNTLNKVIYLDGDILIFSSLRDLWDKLPRENYAIAGICSGCVCPDTYPSSFQQYAIKFLQKYCPGVSFPLHICSGILVLDLDVLRRENLFTKAIDWMVRYCSRWPDQDAINVVLNGRILGCEGKWGTVALSPLTSQPPSKVAILHYIGPQKPWAPLHQIIDHRWWQPRNWSVLWKYTTLQAPTLWHQYRQESPWKHSKWAMLAELFGTHEDRKIFIPFLGMILGIAALPFLGIFYVFLRRYRRRHG